MVNYIAGFILEVIVEYSFTTIAKSVSFTEFGFYLREYFFCMSMGSTLGGRRVSGQIWRQS
jgi:hypothetical protein